VLTSGFVQNVNVKAKNLIFVVFANICPFGEYFSGRLIPPVNTGGGIYCPTLVWRFSS